MTNHEKIYLNLLQNEKTTIEKIHVATKIPENSIALYIRALFNAKYIAAETPHSKIKHNHKISLIKNTGNIAPVLNKNSNLLTDKNILKEYILTPSGEKDKHRKAHKNLVPLLKAIVQLDKEQVFKKEIYQKAEMNGQQLIRWMKRLIACNILLETGEHYRNSPLFDVNIQKTKRLLFLVENFKSSAIAFKVLEKEWESKSQ
jgi:predicted transcriptional regulator